MSTEASLQEKRQGWLQQRRTGIGGSDAAAVLGANPWKSRLELWAEKRGLVESPELDSEAVQWGLKLEGIVLEELARRTGRRVERHPQFEILRHPEYTWMICTPDAFQYDPQRGRGVVQAKTTSAFQRKEWEGQEPPLHYQVQIQHEMLVTGCTWGTLCCLIGGQKFAWFDVELNRRFVSALIEKEREFWQQVQEGVQPEPDGTESCARALAKLYPEETGESVALPPEFLQYDEQLLEINQRIKALQEQKRELENRFKAAIGPHALGVLPDGTVYTYRTVQRKEYTVKATKYRVLRRAKG